MKLKKFNQFINEEFTPWKAIDPDTGLSKDRIREIVREEAYKVNRDYDVFGTPGDFEKLKNNKVRISVMFDNMQHHDINIYTKVAKRFSDFSGCRVTFEQKSKMEYYGDEPEIRFDPSNVDETGRDFRGRQKSDFEITCYGATFTFHLLMPEN